VKDAFEIAGRRVGGGAPVLFIAEAGISHFGDMALARRLLDMAAEAGADVFKIQLFDVEALISSRAADWRERLAPRQLPFEAVQELARMCEARGLVFMATVHDESRIPWLEALDVAALKVGSGERNNPAFLERLARLGKPMIVSTGMHTREDVRETLQACERGGCDRVALLHCVTSYPSPPGEVNLAAMEDLATSFGVPVGYSDHTTDHLAVLAAVARGAAVVEKHITILRNVPNAQDWKVSAGPEDLARLVMDVRRVEALIGDGRKVPAPCEAEGVGWATKSLVAARALPAGHVLARGDLLAKRPGDGLAPGRIAEIVGRTLRRSLAADDPVQLEDLA